MSDSSPPSPPSQNTVPPGPLHGPSPKDRRYDRQLRLWAAHGQEALESSHVLLINSGSGVVGVEALKNLVLPGLGQFTILDPARVTEEDLGVNFFLDEASLGHSRAKRTSELLRELNPETKCYHIPDVCIRVHWLLPRRTSLILHVDNRKLSERSTLPARLSEALYRHRHRLTNIVLDSGDHLYIRPRPRRPADPRPFGRVPLALLDRPALPLPRRRDSPPAISHHGPAAAEPLAGAGRLRRPPDGASAQHE